jgi:pseudouridine synthase
MKLRLHQFLSKTGRFASKRDLKEAVWAGDVTVNGSVVKDIAFQFNPAKKEVQFKGETLRLPSDEITLALNKPPDVVCSRLNSQERSLGKTSVFSLLEGHFSSSQFARFVTVGRLDEATTGLLFLTTDGALAHRIASPEQHISKRYRVTLDQRPSEASLALLRDGLEIQMEENGEQFTYFTQPAEVDLVQEGHVDITVREGKKRQVRRMFSAVGLEVLHLERKSIGGVDLDGLELPLGAWVDLSRADVEAMVAQDAGDKRP